MIFFSWPLSNKINEYSVTLSAPDFARLLYCSARFWLRVLLSCRLPRLDFNCFIFCFGRRPVLSFRPLSFVRGQHLLLLLTVVKQYKFRSVRMSAPDFARLVYCFARFWWRVLLSCRLIRLDLNSVQLSIPFQDGVLRKLHGRFSSFWMCSGRFRRIVEMSKSYVGDVSMLMTLGVALRGRKPGRKYFSSLHLTRWTDRAEPNTFFILALYRMITSSAVLLKSQRLRGFRFGWIPAHFATGLNCAAA